jgi:hypothetical protein
MAAAKFKENEKTKLVHVTEASSNRRPPPIGMKNQNSPLKTEKERPKKRESEKFKKTAQITCQSMEPNRLISNPMAAESNRVCRD